MERAESASDVASALTHNRYLARTWRTAAEFLLAIRYFCVSYCQGEESAFATLVSERAATLVSPSPEFLVAGQPNPLENRFCVTANEHPGDQHTSRPVLRGFLISFALSAGIAAVAMFSRSGMGTLILILFGMIQFIWTLLLFAYFRYNDEPAQARGVLLSCALNLVVYLVAWGYLLPRLVF